MFGLFTVPYMFYCPVYNIMFDLLCGLFIFLEAVVLDVILVMAWNCIWQLNSVATIK